MQITLWGVRGSLPAPLTPTQMQDRIEKLFAECQEYLMARSQPFQKENWSKFLKEKTQADVGGYGGHTACVQVMSPQHNLIVDAGSGIRRVGEKLIAGPCGMGKGEVHILFTHFHWDHLIGLPFFTPIFIPGNKIHMYAVQPELSQIIRQVFQKPFFPVPFERLGAEIIFHKLSPREPRAFGDIVATPYQLDHPDPCWGYRFEQANKTFSYCVDTECTRVSQKELGPDLRLYQNVDLMVFDAQYTFLEATEKIDWGHASAPIGLDIAIREGVKRVLFVHHDPAASDQKIGEAERQTKDYYASRIKAASQQNRSINEVEWGFAHEGMTIDL